MFWQLDHRNENRDQFIYLSITVIWHRVFTSQHMENNLPVFNFALVTVVMNRTQILLILDSHRSIIKKTQVITKRLHSYRKFIIHLISIYYKLSATMKVGFTYILFLLLNSSAPLIGQVSNLLVNPGLEMHDSCKIKHRVDFFNGGFGWERIKPSTPDLFCSGGIPTDNGTPKNYQGVQPPHSGEAYLGLVTEFLTKDKETCREYAIGTLKSPLESGFWYYLEFYYSLADKSTYAMDRLGMKVLKSPLDDNFISTCPSIGKALYITEPDIESTSTLLNTDIWQHVFGTYLAQGGEDRIILGCFRPTDPTLINYRLLNPNQNSSKYSSYYYFDDMRVVKIGVKLPDTVYLCPGEIYALEAQVDTSLHANLQWNTGQSGSKISISSPGQYILSLDFGMAHIFDTTDVVLLPNTLDLGMDTFGCNDRVFVLTPDHRFDSYHWNDGSTLPYLPVEYSGSYSLIVQNKCGQFEDEVFVDILDCTCQVYIPNVFTPNGDGQNDVLGPFLYCLSSEIVQYQFDIYDKWGGKQFTTKDPSEKWNPSKPLPGVYTYQLRMTLLRPDGQTLPFLKSGTISLLK